MCRDTRARVGMSGGKVDGGCIIEGLECQAKSSVSVLDTVTAFEGFTAGERHSRFVLKLPVLLTLSHAPKLPGILLKCRL